MNKEKSLLAFKLLLPFCFVALLLCNLHNASYSIVTIVFLLTDSLTLAWTGWKYYESQQVPKAKVQDSPDEMRFFYPSRQRYLWHVVFNPLAYNQRTWNMVLSIFYMTYIAVVFKAVPAFFYVVVATLALICFIWYDVKENGRILSRLKRMGLICIFNDKGFYQATTHLGTNTAKEFVFAEFTDWNHINRISFYGNYVQMYHQKKRFDVVFFKDKAEREAFRCMLAKYFKQEGQENYAVLTIANASQTLSSLVQPSFRINTKECNAFKLGDSYISPIPSVPKGFKWPVFHKKPLAFVAQINCAELTRLNADTLLPQQGMLYFFYDWNTMLLNETGNNGCSRVVYCDVPNKDLYFARESVNTINGYHLLRQRKLIFENQKTLPNYNKASQKVRRIANTNKDTYFYASWYFLEKDKQRKNLAQMKGSILDEPEMNYRSDLGISEGEDLELLMQLTIDKTDFHAYAQSQNDYSDRGTYSRQFYEQWAELPCTLYYFIPRKDLLKRDFSSVRFACRSNIMYNMRIDLPELGK